MWISQIANGLRNLPHWAKIAVTILVDFVLLCLIGLLAYALRVAAWSLPPSNSVHLYVLGPTATVAFMWLLGIYNSSARGHSNRTEILIAISAVITTVVWAFILLGFGSSGFPRSFLGIYPVLAILALVALRRLASWILVDSQRQLKKRYRKAVVIFGAGQEGAALAEGLERQGLYRPVAFLDTDYSVVNRTIRGIKVYAMEELENVVQRHNPNEALIAKRGQTRNNRRILLSKFAEHNISVKIVPDLDEVTSGNVNVDNIRNIRIEDLLGRDPVPPDDGLMNKAVHDKNVLITGAGGSIGSELVRQAAKYGARKLVLVENSEFALFEIHRELETKYPARAASFLPVLANILDRERMEDIMSKHAVDIVFHAAAYKHVRMVQENAEVGILNNVWGTKCVAEAAMVAKVKRFVLISTDKAVRPTSVMGATKRVAEMIVQALAAEPETKTIFSMVRFGNVLGSTGSVVPLFREQIEAGGPVLVTHPEVTRYFMIIPEAAQLVIQAGAMASGGEVFVLDMGESVKILQLARSMIDLAGMTLRNESNLDGDIEIKFIGLRDGEKMYEELQIGEDVSTTPHSRIMKSNEFMIRWQEMLPILTTLTPEKVLSISNLSSR